MFHTGKAKGEGAPSIASVSLLIVHHPQLPPPPALTATKSWLPWQQRSHGAGARLRTSSSFFEGPAGGAFPCYHRMGTNSPLCGWWWPDSCLVSPSVAQGVKAHLERWVWGWSSAGRHFKQGVRIGATSSSDISRPLSVQTGRDFEVTWPHHLNNVSCQGEDKHAGPSAF